MGRVMARYLWIMCVCVCEVCVRHDAFGTRDGQVLVEKVCVRVFEVCVRLDAHGMCDG